MSNQVAMPSISFVVARTAPGCVIGKDNKLPWRLASDLKRFRTITMGHAVIMGRKTYESIGKPLPGRTNIVLSKRAERDSPIGSPPDNATQALFVNDLETALEAADLFSILRKADEAFVIGGAALFGSAPLREAANRIYLTEVRADLVGDAYFPMEFPSEEWRLLEARDYPQTEKDQFATRFTIYERRGATRRTRRLAPLLSRWRTKEAWIGELIAMHHE